MLLPYGHYRELIPYAISHFLTRSRDSTIKTCRGWELKTMEKTTLTLGGGFLEKYAVDGTSKLKDRAIYHGANTKGPLSFPSDMPPVTDHLAILIAGDLLALYTCDLMTALSLEQRGRSLLEGWQPSKGSQVTLIFFLHGKLAAVSL